MAFENFEFPDSQWDLLRKIVNNQIEQGQFSAGPPSVNSKNLVDNFSVLAASGNLRQLVKSDGTTVALDWQNAILDSNWNIRGTAAGEARIKFTPFSNLNLQGLEWDASYGGMNLAQILLNPNTGEFQISGESGGYFLTFRTNGIERMRIDTSGFVGIGITPATLLHIKGGAAGEAIARFQPNSNAVFFGLEFLAAGGGGVLSEFKLNAGTGECRWNNTATYFPTIYTNNVKMLDARGLYWTDGTTNVVDWNQLVMFDSLGKGSIDWGNRVLADVAENTSVDYANRGLYDVFNNHKLQWDTGITYDTAGIASLDWQGRMQYDAAGIESIRYNDRLLRDSTSVVAVSWNSRILNDAAGINAIWWGSRLLTNAAGDTFLNWASGLIGDTAARPIGFWGNTPIVQPTTAVAAATFVTNTSLIANDSATFDGYTIGQVVKALRNAGLLA